HQPRCLRRVEQAARHHRVGVGEEGEGSAIIPSSPPARFRPPVMKALPVLLFVLLLAPALRAQPATAERVPAAETAFENGLRAYVEGVYDEAARLFLRAAEEFGYNAR